MDNLFNSEKLFSALYMVECLGARCRADKWTWIPSQHHPEGGEEFKNGRVDEGDNKGGTAHWLNKVPGLARCVAVRHKAGPSSVNYSTGGEVDGKAAGGVEGKCAEEGDDEVSLP